MISLVAANRLLYQAHVPKSIAEQAFQRVHKPGTALADQLLLTIIYYDDLNAFTESTDIMVAPKISNTFSHLFILIFLLAKILFANFFLSEHFNIALLKFTIF